MRSRSEEDLVEEDNAYTPVSVLFSGGLDSMILAALLDECLQSDCKFSVSDFLAHKLYSRYLESYISSYM